MTSSSGRESEGFLRRAQDRGNRPAASYRLLTWARDRSGADDFELHRDVVARRMRIRADLLVRRAGERRELGLRQALVLHAELHREAEAAAVARADRDRAGDPRL